LDGISSLAARPQYGQVIIEIKVINADHDTKAAGSGRAGIGSLNKEASTVAPRGFRAGPTTLDHALVVTEEDGGTPQAYSDRDRSQASFCLGRSKAAGNGGAKPSGKITNEAKTIRRFYGIASQNVQLASHSAGAPAGGTGGVSSHADTTYHVHTRSTCVADSNDHVVQLLEGCEWHSRSQAARLARKCPRAFFPSLAASAMLSKNTGERSTGADLPAQ
jgi:hypothetical protein